MDERQKQEFKCFISQKIGLEEDDALSNDITMDELNMDSLDVFELLLDIEGEYNITINENDIQHLKSIGDLEARVAECLSEEKSR